jgi:toxin YoeB
MDKHLVKRIRELLKAICYHLEERIGKPERLKFQLSGCWSRRITEKHRLVYKDEKDTVTVIGCRYHYE